MVCMNDLEDLYPYRFSALSYSKAERFDAWREEHQHHNISLKMREIIILDANFRGMHIGELMLGRWRFLSKRENTINNFAHRSLDKIRKDNLDHYYFRLSLSDTWIYNDTSHQTQVRPSQLAVIDLGQPYNLSIAEGEVIMLMVPRDLLPTTTANFHGAVLNHSLGQLFAEHIRALFLHAPHLPKNDMPQVMQATLGFLNATLSATPDNIIQAQTAIDTTLFNRIRHYIDQNLNSNTLNVNQICEQIGISRSHLYRLFETVGGVASYICSRRLSKVHSILSSQITPRQRIADLAYQYGFSSPVQFARAYKRKFSYSPSETKRIVLPTDEDSSVLQSSSDFWLRSR
ncbi:AraC family transcriptional regulator [Photorhabdus hindustanensis]|uniref:AraC family transcriptional regulator n=2 Tax=Photorhabdus hindustanensis TaxID=2918802 RepID=A0A2S8PWG9_9GAMM|nr:AraC family transcriptional regulator [Photorhabdus hindustanensis]PQQ23294.1 AraC family transcriptional regulator [Photorhabdus hindustanensis]